MRRGLLLVIYGGKSKHCQEVDPGQFYLHRNRRITCWSVELVYQRSLSSASIRKLKQCQNW